MGRKTWESIPKRFRPLVDRVNIVITRNPSCERVAHKESPIIVDSLESAILAAAGSDKFFVIGGAQVYQAALAKKEAKRILFTRILDDFECDVYFPFKLGEDGKAEVPGWTRCSRQQLNEWTGENLQDGVFMESNGTRYIFEMWEKTNEIS